MTEEKLKVALIQAHNKGDKEAANLFARKIKELRSSNNVIPVGTGENAQLVDMNQQPAQQPEMTMGDQALGALETGAALATGATTGRRHQLSQMVSGLSGVPATLCSRAVTGMATGTTCLTATAQHSTTNRMANHGIWQLCGLDPQQSYPAESTPAGDDSSAAVGTAATRAKCGRTIGVDDVI